MLSDGRQQACPGTAPGRGGPGFRGDSLALRDGHQQFSPLHMLKVLLDDSEGLAGGLIDRAGGNSRAILKATEDALNKLPKVSGSGAGQVYLAPELARAF